MKKNRDKEKSKMVLYLETEYFVQIVFDNIFHQILYKCMCGYTIC
jgi:hypothetical protein